MMANSPVVAFGPISKLWIEKLELAFAGFEWQAAGVGERPAERALKPLGRVAFHAIGDLRDADDADGFKGVRQICDAVAAFNVGKGFGRGVGFTLAGMDAEYPTGKPIYAEGIGLGRL